VSTLAGRIAVVTGSTSGIGRGIAEHFAGLGSHVVVHGLNRDDGDETVRRVRAAGREAEYVDGDLADEKVCRELIRFAVRRFGALDILVNNAGVGVFTDVSVMTPVQWADVIDTNLTGVFNACHAALPHMARRGSGFIINISSLSGKNPFAGAAAYCASKAGLNAFSEALMQEVRYDGIRVSCVMPGSVATGFGGGDAAKGDDWKIAPDEVAEVVVNLLKHDPRSLPSRVELRPSRPPRK
jgi:3-oxoacyl-[acyl-carrier protein] reductase